MIRPQRFSGRLWPYWMHVVPACLGGATASPCAAVRGESSRRLYMFALSVLLAHTQSLAVAGEDLQPKRTLGDGTGVADSTHWRYPKNCGVTCCYALLRLKQLEVDWEEVKRAIPVGDRGSNLEAMRAGCEQFGLAVEVIRATPGEFRSLRWPAIAHLTRSAQTETGIGHYVVIVAADQKRVVFLEPTAASIRNMLWGDFFQTWSGYLLIEEEARHDRASAKALFVWIACAVVVAAAILVAGCWLRVRRSRLTRVAVLAGVAVLPISGCAPSEKLDSVEGAVMDSVHITAWERKRDVGPISEDSQATATFRIENSGGREVQLQLGRASCTCASVKLGKSKLAPQESTELCMKLENQGVGGPIRAQVPLTAVGQPWGHVFTAYGFAVGSRCLTGEVVLRSDSGQEGGNVRLMAYLVQAVDPCEVRADMVDPKLEGIVSIGEPSLLPAEPVGRYYAREIRISIHALPEETRQLQETITGKMRVSVTVKGSQRSHQVDLSVCPPMGA